MQQKLTLLFLIIALNVQAQADDSTRAILNRIVSHAETASLYRKNVNWDTLKTQVFALAKEARTVPELSPALKHLLKGIGDEHGRIFHQNQIIAYYYGHPKAHQKDLKPEVYNQVQSGQHYQFEAKVLEDSIGYVRIVGLPMGDNQQMSATIAEGICKVAQTGVNQWIVDLRYNGGGNMFPMAEGLASLIGVGNVGGARGLTTAENAQWKIQDGHFYYDDYSVLLEQPCSAKKSPKVAVLTSVYTASSGEAIAVIFKGRDNTRFFGGKTLGMITVTDWAEIGASTAMAISVSYYQDRNGKIYNQFVDVDEEWPFVEEPLSTADTTVKRAIEWLKRDK